MKVLVTGGAGYIGSITVKRLIEKGHEVLIYDSLIKSDGSSLKILKCPFVKGCLSDKILLDKVFKKFRPEAVLHFAGFIEAGESIERPERFFGNNVVNGLRLLDIMVANNVKKIIYSSSAGVYAPKNNLLKESDLKKPTSVYGETKLIFENILKWYDEVYGIKHISLRYFNAFGIVSALGERHTPETHLIPLVLFAALGKKENIRIFGTDYPTADGTCIRDYVHVSDLADAHILALNNLESESKIYNVGTGKGNSVKDIIDIIKEVTKMDFEVIEDERRAGDHPILVADSSKIQKELGWKPEKNFKEAILETYEYFKKLENF